MTSSPTDSAQQTVILDRDGVINQDSDAYIKSDEEWVPIPGSIDAIAALSRAGFRIVVATNQSGIGRALFDEYALARIHHKMCSMVEKAGGFIDGIFYCPHTPNDQCDCRKPGTGLLRQIESEFGISLAGAYFIGDSVKDVEAALAHGCRPVLVRSGKGLTSELALRSSGVLDLAVFDDLAQAIQELFPVNV